MPEDRTALTSLHERVARAIIARVSHRLPAAPSPYVVHHLAEHVAEADVWKLLADHPVVLDQLEPSTVAAQALRTAFGRRKVPAEIAGVIGAHQRLAAADPAARPLIRMIAAVRHTGMPPRDPALSRLRSRVRAIRVPYQPLNVLLSGHGSAVQALAEVPLAKDGPVLLASGDSGGRLRLWDPVTGRPLGDAVKAHDDGVTALCSVAHDDGVIVASAGRDGVIKLWNPVAGKVLHEFRDHRQPVEALIAFAAPGDPQLVASGSLDGTVRIWDPSSRSPVTRLVQPGAAYGVKCLAAIADTARGTVVLAGGSTDGVIRLWDPVEGTLVHELHGHSSTVAALAVFAGLGGPLLASGSADSTLRLWDPLSGASLGTALTLAGESIETIEPFLTPDNRELLATATVVGPSARPSIRLFDPKRRKTVGHALEGHEQPVRSLRSIDLRDGRRLLVSGSADTEIRLWDPVANLRGASTPGDLTEALVALAPVELSDGRWLIAGGTQANERGQAAPIRLWDDDAQPFGDPLAGHATAVNALTSLRLDGGRTVVASGGDDRAVRLWDPLAPSPGTAELTAPMLGHEVWVTALTPATLPGGRPGLASGSRDTTVRRWDPSTGTPVGGPLDGHEDAVWALAEVGSGTRVPVLASGDNAGRLLLWGVDGEVRAELDAHGGRITALCGVALPGRPPLLASAGWDGRIRRWDPLTGAPVGAAREAHAERITALTTIHIADRPLLVSGGHDSTVRMWDPETGEPVRTFSVDFPVFALAGLGPLLAVAGAHSLLVLDVED